MDETAFTLDDLAFPLSTEELLGHALDDFHWILDVGSPVPVPGGKVAAAFVYQPGVGRAEVYQPGAKASRAYVPGAKRVEVYG